MMGRRLAILFFVVLALVAIIGLVVFSGQGDSPNEVDSDLKKFSSEEEFREFVEDSGSYGYGGMFLSGARDGGMMETANLAMDSVAAPTSKEAFDYSTTNIQVEGVDEADIVKNDGEYIYVVSGKKVVILDAFPADDMKILAEINLSGNVNEIFINEDKLVVFGNDLVKGVENEELDDENMEIMKSSFYYPMGYDPAVLTYDISDRENPILENSVVLDGNYVDSRMIGEYVYVVSNKYVYADVSPPIYFVNGIERSVAFGDIYYPTFRDNSYQFTSVSVLNIESGEFDTETYLLGTSYTMYVSENNIYLTQFKSASYEESMEIMIEDVYMEILPGEYRDRLEKIQDMDEYYDKDRAISDLMSEWMKSMEGEEVSDLEEELGELMEKASVKISKLQGTAIYRIELDGMDIEYVENGFVPGQLLDQFSMDEYEGNLRVAVTTGQSWWGSSVESLNHMYILDEELEIIGSVEDLAEGERIFSSRFMGDRAYMVTFRQVDPLFVIDLSDSENPKVMGELKITGFSDYLHPYDEDHLIGIGKEATEEGRALGLKVSLFDVSDIENPVEVAKIEIGDKGTSSDALYDHKAVLFDREKNLLVLPVDLYEINESSKRSWGEFVWQGAMVLDVSLDEIRERGRISHRDDEVTDEGYWKQYQSSIRRSLYMDDVLYTISQTKVRANELGSLDEIKEVVISEVEDGPVFYAESVVF